MARTRPLQGRRIDQAVGVEHDQYGSCAAQRVTRRPRVASDLRVDVWHRRRLPTGMKGAAYFAACPLQGFANQERIVESERITISTPRWASYEAPALPAIACSGPAVRSGLHW